MSRHRHKTDEEKKILKQCIEECNRLPRRSTEKRKKWLEYVDILKQNGFDYTVDEVYAYYNNRKNDDNKKQQNPTSPQEQSSLSITPTPQLSPEPSITSFVQPQQQKQTPSPFLPLQPLQEYTPLIPAIPPSLAPSPFFPMIVDTPPPSSPLPPPPPPPPSPPPQPKFQFDSSSSEIIIENQQNFEQSPVSIDSHPLPEKQSPYSFSVTISEESPSSSSSILPFDESTESNDDELMRDLVDVPHVGDDISIDQFDNLKFRLYELIQRCYSVISRSYDHYKSIDEKSLADELLKCQEEVERRFVEATNIFTDKLNIKQIYSYDKKVPQISGPKFKRTISTLTRIYNKEDISPHNSGTLPLDKVLQQFNSSADIARTSSKSSADNNPSNKKQLNDCLVVPFNKQNLLKNLTKKLENLYMGIYDKDTVFSQEINNVESATIISFRKDENNEFLDFAYVNYQENAHMLHFRNLTVETGFFLRATAMYFHRMTNDSADEEEEETIQNLLYICGDRRIKEFSIKKLDEGESKGQIEIVNTRTFYFGAEFYRSSVITVWQDELVFGCDSTVYFWNINDRKSDTKKDIKNNKNLNKALNSGVDVETVDWTKGQTKSDMITIETMERITSLEVINDDKNSESYLAIASENYPVVYICNSQHLIVKKLIAHTMGVTSIKFTSNRLITGSLDYTVKIWDLEKCNVVQSVDTLCQRITAIQTGFYQDKFVLITAGEDSTVMVWSITDKKALFEFRLDDDFKAKHLAFVTEKNEICGEIARLMMISDNSNQNTLKTCKIHMFEFK